MKKKICFVNCSSNGSTGNIVKQLVNYCGEQFNYCFILGDKAPNEFKNVLSLSHNQFLYKIARLQTFTLGNDGFILGSNKRKIKRFLNKQKPDLIHIHNAHRSYCNIDVIFSYCKKNNVKIIWTLHDQWAFTGHCCNSQNCEKWKHGCGNCPNKEYYPRTLLDNSSYFYKKKIKLYNSIKNDLTFVCPSKWLTNIIKQVETPNEKITINNGIDTNVFKLDKNNELIKKMANGRFVIGGAALYFNAIKGGEIFEQLSTKLASDKYFIVLIGSSYKDIKIIRDNLVLLPRTTSMSEMSQFYNSIDVFINPTKTDNYPTTHLESISCGTPVITFDVGGASEMIQEGVNGFSVPFNNPDKLIEKIIYISANKDLFLKKNIATSSDFSLAKFCNEYLKLYKKTIN